MKSAWLSAATIFFLFSPSLNATTWIVSNLTGRNCSNTGNGTSSQPFCSIQEGVNHARSGDTVSVEAGTYGPGPTLNVAVSGTLAAPIVIRANPLRSAVIVGPAGQGTGDASNERAVVITGSNIVFDGFEVKDAAGSGIKNGGDYVVIRNNYVHHNAFRCDPSVITKCGQGIASNSGNNNVSVVIERNVSAFNGSGRNAEDHNYYLSGPGMLIRNNVSTGSDDFGFQIYPNCDNCEIYNNVAHASGRSGFLVGGDGQNYSTNVRFFNNIAIENGQYGFDFYVTGNQAITLKNNLAFSNASGAVENPSGFGNITVLNTLTSDPLFVNSAARDFHLRPGSPAIDAGDSNLFPPDDLDGESRPRGNGVDIGVDEYSGVTPTPTPSPTMTPTPTATPTPTPTPTLSPTPPAEDVSNTEQSESAISESPISLSSGCGRASSSGNNLGIILLTILGLAWRKRSRSAA